MIKNAKKSLEEQTVELMTGITIEQWEENNRKLEELLKVQEAKKKHMQEANDQISMSMGYL